MVTRLATDIGPRDVTRPENIQAADRLGRGVQGLVAVVVDLASGEPL